MKTNQDYKNAALAALKGNWAPAVFVTVVFLLITTAIVLPSEIPLFKMQDSAGELAAMAEDGVHEVVGGIAAECEERGVGRVLALRDVEAW